LEGKNLVENTDANQRAHTERRRGGQEKKKKKKKKKKEHQVKGGGVQKEVLTAP